MPDELPNEGEHVPEIAAQLWIWSEVTKRVIVAVVMGHKACSLATTSFVSEIDIFVSSTGNFNIITLDNMKRLESNAFIGSTGHFDCFVNHASTVGY